MQESIELVDILQKYKEASRKKINRSKKQVFNEVKKRVGKKLILKALLCIFILKASIFLVHWNKSMFTLYLQIPSKSKAYILIIMIT